MVRGKRLISGPAVKTAAGRVLNRFDVQLVRRSELTVFGSHNTPKKYWNEFSQTIENLSENYRFLDPNELTEYLGQPDDFREGPYAMLSFDDGFANNYAVAEHLADRGIRAVFFVSTEFVNQHDSFGFYKRNILRNLPPQELRGLPENEFESLTPNQVAAIGDMGHTIGSHTVNHADIGEISADDLEFELLRSREKIKEWTGRQPRYFASTFDSRGLTVQAASQIRAVYDHHFSTLDLSNRHYGGHQVFRTNLEFYWSPEMRSYATRARTPEHLRWWAMNRSYRQRFHLG